MHIFKLCISKYLIPNKYKWKRSNDRLRKFEQYLVGIHNTVQYLQGIRYILDTYPVGTNPINSVQEVT